MANGKKSFVLYSDMIHTVQHLTDEQAGKLLKHLLLYVNDQNPETNDPITKLAFEPIKQQLKRDLKKFEEVKKKRSEAGKASAKKRKQKATNSTSVKSVEQSSTNSTVNDNVNVNVNDNVINNTFSNVSEFLKWFNGGKRHYTGTEGKTKDLKGTDLTNFKYLNKTYERKDFAHALRMMSRSEWVKDNKMFTPQHFLRENNFTKYLNQEDNKKEVKMIDPKEYFKTYFEGKE